MAVSISQASQIKLARSLVNPSKDIRDKCIASLSSFLNSIQSDEHFTELEMLKLWKALYYCMWLTDKVEIQTECATFLCDFIDSCSNKSIQLLYIQSFYKTILREWPLLDQHRLDKFYKLLRFILRKILSILHTKSFPNKLTNTYMTLLCDEILSKTPSGIRYHIFDIFLSELYIVTEGDVSTKKFINLLQHFIQLLISTKDKACQERIIKKIFELYLNKYAIENTTSNETNIDGSSTPTTVFAGVDTKTIQSLLFATASSESTPEYARSVFYAIHKQFANKTKVAFVGQAALTASHVVNGSVSNGTVREVAVPVNGKRKGGPDSSEEAAVHEGEGGVKQSKKKKTKHSKHTEEDTTTAEPPTKKVKKAAAEPENKSLSSPEPTIEAKNNKLMKAINKHELKQQKATIDAKVTKIPTPSIPPIDIPTAPTPTHTVPATLTPTHTLTSTETSPEPFIASAKFAQAKPGYVFKKGNKGVGYYIDPVQTKLTKAATKAVAHPPSTTPSKKRASPGADDKKTTPTTTNTSTDHVTADATAELSSSSSGAKKAKADRRVSFGRPQEKGML